VHNFIKLSAAVRELEC